MNQAFRQQYEAELWEPIPKSVISREGHVVDTSGVAMALAFYYWRSNNLKI